jgi:DNA-binding HxlR family transcriptional regulator
MSEQELKKSIIAMNSLTNDLTSSTEKALALRAEPGVMTTCVSIRTLDTSYTEQVARVINLLEGKWTVQILCAMREHPVRLSDLKRAIPTASKKALTASLRSLEAAQVVLRRDLSNTVLRVEYELADTMREPLVTLLDHLAEWGRLYDSEERRTVSLLTIK